MKITGEFEVDTGGIVVIDFQQIPSIHGVFYWKTDEEKCKKVEIDPGRYEIQYSVPNTWYGPVTGKEVIDVSSGQLIIGDPCYFFSGSPDERFDWGFFLGATRLKTFFSNIGFNIDTGGDFFFDVELVLKKLPQKDDVSSFLTAGA